MNDLNSSQKNATRYDLPLEQLVFDRGLRLLLPAPHSLRLVALTGALKNGLAGKGVIQSRGYICVFRRETTVAKSA